MTNSGVSSIMTALQILGAEKSVLKIKLAEIFDGTKTYGSFMSLVDFDVFSTRKKFLLNLFKINETPFNFLSDFYTGRRESPRASFFVDNWSSTFLLVISCRKRFQLI